MLLAYYLLLAMMFNQQSQLTVRKRLSSASTIPQTSQDHLEKQVGISSAEP